MGDIVQWLVRDHQGEITGPLTTVEVIRKIRSGIFVGEEYISRFPAGRWHPISYDQNFFDALLETLEGELSDDKQVTKEVKDDVTQRILTLKQENEVSKQIKEEDETKPEEKQNNKGEAVFEDFDAKTPLVIEMEKSTAKVGKAVVDENISRKKKPVKRKKLKRKTSSRRNRRMKLQVALLLAASVVVMGVYVFLQQGEGGTKQVHLRRPKFKSSKKMNKAEIQLAMKRAIQFFRADSFNNYVAAQDALVEVISRSRNVEAFGFLCMTYRELWPYTHQDSRDYKTLELVMGRIQKINPTSPSANICLVVSHWVKGRYDDALRIMDNALIESPGLIFFNHMVGDIYAARRDYRSASYYFAKVRELWKPPPVWSKSLLQEARMYRKRNVHGSAIKLYRNLLNSNPQHAVAKIELGILEFEPYQNISKARDYINGGLNSGQFIPKMIEAEAYVTLAKISIIQGNNREALKFSQRAFSIDSSNEESRELIVAMGGIKALNSVSIDNVNLVYLGEQYMKMNNFTAAQAEFRGAFEANPQNGFAALRAGEAFWSMGQSSEAITWIKKSIDADPNFIRSYIILSDFQSARFDYENAIETLKSALRINPRHHGIFRGFALIELRRRSYAGAVRYAKKALELYNTDIPSLIILAKALNKQGESEEAFNYLQQALELDPSNGDVHVTFAGILAALKGTDAGIDYLDSMISKYGKVEYMEAIGELLTDEERNAEAIQYYYDALEKSPENKGILMALAKVLQYEKRYEESRDYFLEAAALDPTDAEPLYLIGQLYLDSGKANEALKQFEKVIDVNPHYPFAHYYAGQAQLKLKNYDGALKMAEQERLMNPEVPEPYLLAGEAYYNKRQYVLCRDEYQKVLQKGLNQSDVYIKLARCQRLLGDFDSALTMLTRAEKTESGNPDTFKELGALYDAQGYYIKAMESYNRYIQLSPNAKDKKEIERLILMIDQKGREE